MRTEIKQLIKQSVPESELTLIVIDKNNSDKLLWLDKNEFKYEGNMFDIVRTEKGLESDILYFCINDKQEKNLFANLNRHIQNNFEDKKRNDSSQSPLKHLVKDYLKTSISDLNIFPIFKIVFSPYNDWFESFIPGLIFPPPKKL